MKLFPLTVDFAFKALFAPNPDLLMDLINSFPFFQNENRVVALQAFPKDNFEKRILFYWAKVYSRGLKKGQDYGNLKKVHSIKFLNFSLRGSSRRINSALTKYRIIEEELKIPLTDDLVIHIIELPNFLKSLGSLRTDLEYWFYLLQKSEHLTGDDVKALEKKSPSIKKAISELKNISRSPRSREHYETRLKAELDYNSGIKYAFNQGIEKGRLEALETIYLGIQLNLESRFNAKDDTILKAIPKTKDIQKLNKILLLSAQAKTLSEFKKSLKSIK